MTLANPPEIWYNKEKDKEILMKQNKPETIRRSYTGLSYGVAFVTVLALAGLGAWWLFDRFSQEAAEVLLLILLAVIALWYGGNALFRLYRQKAPSKQKVQVSTIRGLQDGGEKTLPRLQRRLEVACFFNDLAFAFLVVWLIGFCMVLYTLPGMAIIAVYVARCLIHRYMPRRDETPFDYDSGVDREEYAALYQLAEEAQRAVGGDRRIRIYLDTDSRASVLLQKNDVRLFLGAILLQCLSREEVYQVLLHEFAHMQNRRQMRYRRRQSRIEAGEILFSVTDYWEAQAYGYYRFFASRYEEAWVDGMIAEKGDPQAAANGLAKIHCYAQYENGFLSSDTPVLFYAAETPPKHWISHLSRDFQAAVVANESFAEALIRREVSPKTPTHPITRDRIRALGVESISLQFPTHQGAWSELCQRVLAWADNFVFEAASENYENERKKAYLRPQRRIARWNASAKNMTYESTRKVLEALYELQQYGEVIALSEDFAATGASETERCHAIFYEGLSRLRLRDKTGLEQLYRVSRVNLHYMDAAMEAIADYCFVMGLEEEVERYRRFIRETEGDYYDWCDMFPLRAGDRITASDLPAEKQAENLAVIRAVAGESLQAVYLLKKTVSERVSRHFYVLQFRDGTEGVIQQKIYDRVFMHLNKQEEGYCLEVWNASLKWLSKRKKYRVL